MINLPVKCYPGYVESGKTKSSMHEFSIALNIIDIAEDTAKTNHAKRINEVEIEIGDVSGVVYEALDLALQSAVKNTMLETAHIHLKRIKAEAVCTVCGKTYTPDNLVSECPNCGALNTNVTKGKEMKVISINID